MKRNLFVIIFTLVNLGILITLAAQTRQNDNPTNASFGQDQLSWLIVRDKAGHCYQLSLMVKLFFA
jgi:hypothetical protein